MRNINKHARYSGNQETLAELLIYFCKCLKNSEIPFENSLALSNLYAAQIKKIKKAIESMHEDLQYDFKKELKNL